jgi:hypothetical protein
MQNTLNYLDSIRAGRHITVGLAKLRVEPPKFENGAVDMVAEDRRIEPNCDRKRTWINGASTVIM